MKYLVRVAAAVLVIAFGAWLFMLRMPGASYAGATPALAPADTIMRDQLRRDVEELAGRIGPRSLDRYEALGNAADYLEGSLAAAGYSVQRETFDVATKNGQRSPRNLFADLPGRALPEEILVIGAHYDTDADSETPGADDNASGTAAVLTLARAYRDKPQERTVRFVLFTNEEEPYFQQESMGSLVHARRAKARRENIVAMLSLETIGYYSDAAGSQHYPFPLNLLYPSTGNFLGFVGNTASRDLVRRAVGSFRKVAKVPSEGAAALESMKGVDWSDHWSFWRQGYPALMVTDTALYRNTHYHTRTDLPDKLDYDRLTLVVRGLEEVIADLASGK